MPLLRALYKEIHAATQVEFILVDSCKSTLVENLEQVVHSLQVYLCKEVNIREGNRMIFTIKFCFGG